MLILFHCSHDEFQCFPYKNLSNNLDQNSYIVSSISPMDFILGGLAASGACLFSNPFDVIKTRMQLQGELRRRGEHAVFYKNVFHGGWVIAKNEGIHGLQKGLVTAIFMHSIRNSTRLGKHH